MACAEIAIAGLPAPADAGARPGKGRWRSITIVCLRALAIVLLVRLFFGEASVVPTGSMERTIMVGDHLFWVKAFYGPEIPFTHWRLPRLKSVRRGDIVAFHYPRDPRQIFHGGTTARLRCIWRFGRKGGSNRRADCARK